MGSCKREIVDHMIVFNQNRLRRLLRDYVGYYNAERVHTVIRDAPDGRAIQTRPSLGAKVVGLPLCVLNIRPAEFIGFFRPALNAHAWMIHPIDT